jgi:phage gp29-like protein
MMIYDQYGRPVDTGSLREEQATPQIMGVRQLISEHPAQGLTPGKLASLLKAAEDGDIQSYLELAEEMEEKDLHYRSVLSTRKLQVSGLEITVESASDDKDDVKAADLVRDYIANSDFALTLPDILDALGKGFSLCEILWETGGKVWMPQRIVLRDPRWFVFDKTDAQTPLLRVDANTTQPLAPYKYIFHLHKGKSGLPIRGGLARAAAWCYLFKNFDIKSWVQFADAYGHPLRVGKYGPGATKDDKNALLTAVRNIARDAAAIIPESMKIDFIEAKLSGNIDLFERLASYLDRQISKLVLGQTGTTDTGQHVGTANAHEHVRDDIEKHDAMQVGATLNRDLVRPLVDLNLGPRTRYPRLKIFRPDQADVTALVNNIEKLIPLGLRVEASWIGDRLGIPDPDPDANILTAVKTGSAIDTTAASQSISLGKCPIHDGTAAHAARLDGSAEAEGDALDDLARESLSDWEPIAEPMIDPIRTLLAECSDYNEFLRRLPEVVGNMDSKKLAERLAESLFAARLAGEVEADLV